MPFFRLNNCHASSHIVLRDMRISYCESLTYIQWTRSFSLVDNKVYGELVRN